MNLKTNKYVIYIGILIFCILLRVFIKFLYSHYYDKQIVNYILKSPHLLNQDPKDTIFVIDTDYKECGLDSREFINKELTRPYILKQLKHLGYQTIVFQNETNTQISTNNSPLKSIPYKLKNKNNPIYEIHIWKSFFGIIPYYTIDIDETYFSQNSQTNISTDYQYFLFSQKHLNRHVKNNKNSDLR